MTKPKVVIEPKVIIEIDSLDFAYNGIPVLEDITFSVPEGDFLGVIGPNGSGKTTLLKILLGLLQPSKGKVRVFGQAPESIRHLIGYVPQHTELDPSFPISVMDVVLTTVALEHCPVAKNNGFL